MTQRIANERSCAAFTLVGMDKDQLRNRARAQTPIEPDVGLSVVSGLFVWLSERLPGTVSAYLALPDEVDVTPLFERLPGWRWILPRVELDGSLTFRDREIPREVHRFGMEQPVEQGQVTPVHEIDVFLVPGMAFDVTGGRLGRGAGYYDRLLAERRPDATAIGVATDRKMIESVPVFDHDQRVDWLATESGVRECSPMT
jgi:5-formyltetrahydrofolate cyclo-ligase